MSIQNYFFQVALNFILLVCRVAVITVYVATLISFYRDMFKTKSGEFYHWEQGK